MPRRELLMLAKVYDAMKHQVGSWYISEKLDGCRCFWDGGITRGLETVEVPWAGLINPKTGQTKVKIKPMATGLWSRYGNPIMAPEWFLNSLPRCPLDGELWAGQGKYQKLRSYVGKHIPVDEEWKKVQFGVFGTPDLRTFIRDGEIKNPNQHTVLKDVESWMQANCTEDLFFLAGEPDFASELANLNEWVDHSSETYFLIRQTKLPDCNIEAARIVEEEKKRIILEGGEGVFLRNGKSFWTPKRVPTSLKVKGALDDEGMITGFVSGRKTDKGSKLLGLIGAIILDYKGQRLELSGLTNEEREFMGQRETDFASDNPGEDMPSQFQGKMFKVGDNITFLYRELTDKGLPKEARYWRLR